MSRVLVVDDHDDARELVVMIVSLHGHEVVTASNGLQAVDEARRTKPDAIIMDLFMPVMDGFEASRLLKADPSLSSIPIVAYTARASTSGFEDGLFAACCIKPCPPDELLDTLQNALAATQPGTKGEAEGKDLGFR
jgi:CheY-like chemotaxis protein